MRTVENTKKCTFGTRKGGQSPIILVAVMMHVKIGEPC